MKKMKKYIIAILLCLYANTAQAALVKVNVVEGDIKGVLSSIARLGDLDIIIDDSVEGKITVDLEEMEAIDAIKYISEASSLTITEYNNVVLISSAYDTSRAFYKPHIFFVKYADLEMIKKAIKISLNQAGFLANEKNIGNSKVSDLSTTSREEWSERLIIDNGTNAVVLYGTSEEARAAEKIITALDKPAKQVSLEAKVIAIQRDAAKELGVEWEWSKLPQYPEYTTTYDTVRRTALNADGSYTTVSEDVPRTTVVRRNENGGPTYGILNFGKSVDGHPFEFYYAAKINALITDGKASILARPNIMTLQGREAVINIGGEVPVPTVKVTNSTTTTSIEYRQAGIILRYTPRINPDGQITAYVHTEVSSPVYVEELKAYRFNKRSADTMVRLKDGETMVIGGLISSEETKALSKVPILGDIPVLGALFKNIKKGKSDSEVMIFLTAKILSE